ncbi:MAG: ABC transporter permease, partial [Bacteroidota bacterium]|nr:ABC transporter permease [Bacteroidota bacterium]
MLINNYIKIAIRNLFRYKIFSFINIFGLVIGFSVSMLILSYVLDELSYDSFHKDVENIYRIPVKGEIDRQRINIAVNSAPIAPSLVHDNEDIINYTRILKANQLIFFNSNYGKYYEENFLFVDSTFFNVFSFNLIKGNKDEVLKKPHSLVITERIADKYFGDKNPIGKHLMLNNEYDYVVTGIVKDNAGKSHINIDFLASFSTLEENSDFNNGLKSWTSFTYHSYIKTEQNANVDTINSFLADYIDRKMQMNLADEGIFLTPYLQPVKKIHLHSDLLSELEENGDMDEIYIYSAIALFLLLIACINFVNLTTAHSANRAKEVGVRKILGADRKMLVHQYVGESVFLSVIAYIFSLCFIELLLPVFNNVVGKDLELIFITKPLYLLVFLFITVIVGVLSGTYPAFFISRFNPVKVLKRKVFKFSSKSIFRNFLVVFQFLVSITLIISTGVVYKQLNYIKNKPLGFSEENVLVIPILDKPMRENIDSIKKTINNLPGVINVSSSSNIPGKEYSGMGFVPEGTKNKKTTLIFTFKADTNFISTMNINLLKVRDFKDKSDSNCVIVNETLCKQLNWEHPIGKKLFYDVDNNK